MIDSARWSLRTVVLTAGIALALAGAFGLISRGLFHQPDTLKYALTIAGPAFVALLALVRKPLHVLVGLAILVAPFNFVATFAGIQVTPLLAVLVIAVPMAALGSSRSRSGWLFGATAMAVLFLVPGLVQGSQPAVYVEWLAETVAVGWLCAVVAREPGGTWAIVTMVVLSALVQAALAVYEYKSRHLLNLYSSSGVSTAGPNYFYAYGSTTRSSGALPDPIALGNVLALAIPLLIVLAAWVRDWRARVASCVAGALLMLGLVVSFSRMSWIGAGVGTVLCLILLPRRVRRRTVLAVTAVALVAGGIGLSLGGGNLQRRLESVVSPTNVHSQYAGTATGDRLRLRLWTAAIKAGEAEPLGTGFGRFVPALNKHGVSVLDAADAQSWYLQILLEAGVLGAIGMLGLIVGAVRDLVVGARRDRLLAAGAAGALAAIALVLCTDVSPRYVQVSAMIAALLGTVAASARPARERAARSRTAGDRARGEGTVGASAVAGSDRAAPELILAGGLPGTRRVLIGHGVPFAVRPVDTEGHSSALPRHAQVSSVHDSEAIVRRAALLQATLAARPKRNEVVLSVCNSAAANGWLLGVPADVDQARTMLRAVNGRPCEIVGGVAALWPGGVKVATTRTNVALRAITDSELEAYLESGWWRGRPGGIAVEPQANLAADVAGDYENALGLPVSALLEIYPRLLEHEALGAGARSSA